jgi:hypothetical protein
MLLELTAIALSGQTESCRTNMFWVGA